MGSIVKSVFGGGGGSSPAPSAGGNQVYSNSN